MAAGGSGTSNAAPDFAKLPDIGGFLRVGLTIDQSKDAIIKMHPSVKTSYGIGANDNIVPASRDGNPPLQALLGKFPGDGTQFYYTQPPNGPQVAFGVGRQVQYPAPGIDYEKLVAALHQKYGAETMAGYYSAEVAAIPPNMLYWVYDEQGHVISADQAKKAPIGHQGAPFNCGNGPGKNSWTDWMNQYRLNTLPPPKFCDTAVTLTIHLVGGRGPITSTETTIYDQALLRRDVNDAGAVAKAKSQQQQQQQLAQSKQAKPSL